MNQPVSTKPKEFLCIVHGNVQGVSFRLFAQEKARGLGVTGYAKNLEDGTVEVVAQGPEDKLKEYSNFMYTGPEDAEVESAEIQWGPVTEPYTQFDIL